MTNDFESVVKATEALMAPLDGVSCLKCSSTSIKHTAQPARRGYRSWYLACLNCGAESTFTIDLYQQEELELDV